MGSTGYWELTPQELSAFLLSLKIALCCTVLLTIPGIIVGWLLAKKQFFGKALLDACVHLPLVLPPVVPGYLLLLLLGNQGLIGKWLHETFDISIAFTWQGAVVASAVMSFPLMVRAVRLSFEMVEPQLEWIASTLGAHPLQVFFTISLPLALPGVVTGIILAFSRSLGEFGATITFVGNIPDETRTLPLAIYSVTQTPGGEGAALRLVVLSTALAFSALLASDVLAKRTQRLIGR